MLRFESYRDWRHAVESRNLIRDTEAAHEGMHESDPFEPTYAVNTDGDWLGWSSIDDHVLFDTPEECYQWIQADAGDIDPEQED